jgi:hypothetical protein
MLVREMLKFDCGLCDLVRSIMGCLMSGFLLSFGRFCVVI